jgi:predicted methyltransferase
MRSSRLFLLAAGIAVSTMGASYSPAVAKPARKAAAKAEVPVDYAAAVAASDRPADAVKLDESRKPAEVLKFMGLRRGDAALDLFTGSGYYAEIMARAVGPTGRVTAWEPANFLNDKSKAEWTALHGRVPNTAILVTPANAVSLPSAAYDFAMIHLNYHDTYWENAKYNFPRLDPNAFLKTLFDAMKPGGVVAVVDHVANAGGDTREVVDKLHRIDPATAKADFERAGFVLEAQSDMFRNPADDHSKLVFDPSVRGNTDRFVYRFRKPKA